MTGLERLCKKYGEITHRQNGVDYILKWDDEKERIIDTRKGDSMAKLKGEDILIPGAKLKIDKIDFNSPEIQKVFSDLRQKQQECLERKKVDWNKLKNTYINI